MWACCCCGLVCFMLFISAFIWFRYIGPFFSSFPFLRKLTDKLFLFFQTLLDTQSKRVPVSIRYSAESGLKPFFLTTAKRIKDVFPDVVLERVILPKVDHVSESTFDTKSGLAWSTFEVLVDGKVVVRTAPGRKGGTHQGNNEMTVFISMQELDGAISRARRRRRPSNTVYGGTTLEEEYDKSRLAAMKNKAREINSRNAQLDNKK
jgi:hypothetical protein